MHAIGREIEDIIEFIKNSTRSVCGKGAVFISVCEADTEIIHQRSDLNIHYSFENPFFFKE